MEWMNTKGCERMRSDAIENMIEGVRYASHRKMCLRGV